MPDEQTEIRTGDQGQVVVTPQAEGCALLYIHDGMSHAAEVHLTPEYRAGLAAALAGDETSTLTTEVSMVLGNPFLELTERPGHARVLVNADHIDIIRPDGHGGSIISLVGGRDRFTVAESFDDLRAMTTAIGAPPPASPGDDPESLKREIGRLKTHWSRRAEILRNRAKRAEALLTEDQREALGLDANVDEDVPSREAILADLERGDAVDDALVAGPSDEMLRDQVEAFSREVTGVDIPGDCGDPECPGVTHGHMTTHDGILDDDQTAPYVAHHHCTPDAPHRHDG